ncbi:unnamed protein product [Lupinus luteus]|uniref:Uncharacterized protein n=1 Tax=Lupinus luteus TaxID=3873 RepID=A0AAV1WPV3_LUPLU
MMEVSIEVDKILNKTLLTASTSNGDINCQTDQVRTNDTTISSIDKDDVPQAKGIKKKGSDSCVKGRPKSCVERKKKSKDNDKFSSMRHNFSLSMSTPTTQNIPVLQGYEVPATIDLNLTQTNNHSQDGSVSHNA